MKCPSSHMNRSVNTLTVPYRLIPSLTVFLLSTKPTDSAIRTRTDTAPSPDSSWEHESSSCRRHQSTIISPIYFISCGCSCVITHWRLSACRRSGAPRAGISTQPSRNPQRHGSSLPARASASEPATTAARSRCRFRDPLTRHCAPGRCPTAFSAISYRVLASCEPEGVRRRCCG